MARIYVANLAAYVAGRLHGEWIDLDMFADVDDVRAEIQQHVVKRWGGEEYAIHDYEGFGDWRVGEYESLEDVFRVHEFLVDHDPIAVGEWISHRGGDVDDALETFESAYHGQYDSGEDFAESWVIDTQGIDVHDMPDYFAYVDFERYWDGQFSCDGWFITDDGHVFDGNV